MKDEAALFEIMEASYDFLLVQHDKIRSKYPNQWIAVREGKVVASAAAAKTLNAELKRLGLDDNQNLVEFIVAPDTRIMAMPRRRK